MQATSNLSQSTNPVAIRDSSAARTDPDSNSSALPIVTADRHHQGYFPLDLYDLVFQYFLPPDFSRRYPYDAAPLSVVNQPSLITFANLGLTSKALLDVVNRFRSQPRLFGFQNQWSRLEFENALKRQYRTDKPKNSQDPRVLDEIRGNCRLRRGIDPVVPRYSHTPQRAQVHVILGPDDLASAELGSHFQKEWRPDQSHMLYVDKLASNTDCMRLAEMLREEVEVVLNESGDAEEISTVTLLRERAVDLVELDINLIASDFSQKPLADAIKNCSSLQHLSICKPSPIVLNAVASLKLQSLKLRSCPVSAEGGATFETLAAGSIGSTLQCLSISTASFPIEELEALGSVPGPLSNLRDLRLLPVNTAIDSDGGAEIAKALDAMKSLESLSISRINSGVATHILPVLMRLEAFRQLEFDLMTLNAVECATLLEQVSRLPLLTALALWLDTPLNRAAAGHLRSMFEKNGCWLEHLRLRNCGLKADVATELANGLNDNRSLKSFTLIGTELDSASATSLGKAVGNHPGLLEVQLSFENTTAHATRQLLEGALASNSLMALNLTSNGWSEEAESAVLNVLKGNTSLVQLSLPTSYVDSAARRAHAEVLAANRRRGRVWDESSSS